MKGAAIIAGVGIGILIIAGQFSKDDEDKDKDGGLGTGVGLPGYGGPKWKPPVIHVDIPVIKDPIKAPVIPGSVTSTCVYGRSATTGLCLPKSGEEHVDGVCSKWVNGTWTQLTGGAAYSATPCFAAGGDKFREYRGTIDIFPPGKGDPSVVPVAIPSAPTVGSGYRLWQDRTIPGFNFSSDTSATSLEQALTKCNQMDTCTHVQYDSSGPKYFGQFTNYKPGTTSMVMTESGARPQYVTYNNIEVGGSVFATYPRNGIAPADAPSCAAQCMTVWTPDNQYTPTTSQGLISVFGNGSCQCKATTDSKGTSTYVKRSYNL